MLTDPGRVPLARRAWIGDGSHGASVAPDGTIDWYAIGGIDAAPQLWRLLDPAGSAVRVGPVRDSPSAHLRLPPSDLRYRTGTSVAETVSEAAGGRRLSVVDFMPWAGPGRDVTGRIVRLVRALSGPLDVEVEVLPGRRPSGAKPVAATGGMLVVGGGAMGDWAVSAPAPFEPAPLDRDTERWRSVFRLEAGEEAVVTVAERQLAGLSLDAARRLLDDTEVAWRAWLAAAAYGGLYTEAVNRALLSLRALTSPSGALRAAGTTSLPRRVGSERTVDGRWFRVRDVARAARLYALAGLAEEAEEAETWLRPTVETAHLPWPAWLDGQGQPVPEAGDLGMEGWRKAGPVMSGIALPPVFDVGLLGDVAAAIGSVNAGPLGRTGDAGPLSAAHDALADAADWAADHWRRPDHGRWDIAEPLRLYTAGRLSLWSGLDRLSRLARAANPLDLQAAAWWGERADLLRWMEKNAVADDGGLTLAPGTSEADAALLEIAWAGPWPASHHVVAATVERTLERLGSGAFLYRYSDRVADERSGPDNPDIEASLLAVKALAHLGRWEEAHERMESVVALSIAAGPGLVGETASPEAGEMFGNFPCSSAALALVDAALALEAGPA